MLETRPPRRPLRALTRRRPDGARQIVVPAWAAGERLDGFLQRHGGEAARSRSEWQRLIGLEAVTLNGSPTKPSQRVMTGDRVGIAPAPPQREKAPPGVGGRGPPPRAPRRPAAPDGGPPHGEALPAAGARQHPRRR